MQNIAILKFLIKTLTLLILPMMGYNTDRLDRMNAVVIEEYSTISPTGDYSTDRPSEDMNAILEEDYNMRNAEQLIGSSSLLLLPSSSVSSSLALSSTPVPTIGESSTAPSRLFDGFLPSSASATTVRTYLGMQRNVTLKSTVGKPENKFVLPKPQKTDAPMLNYIFDSFSTANKHHHHDQRYGPHFEDIVTDGNVTNITVQAGGVIYLNCRISLLQDKTVSWVKRKTNGGESALQLLTVGMHTYSGDSRYTMEFQYPNNWRLKIGNARKSDEGIYECQISTHPPRVIQINLHVNAPKVTIVDEYGAPLQEKYYEIDSTLQLSCVVRNVVMSSSVVFWSHGEQILNYDTTRGGVSVKTELMEDGANSTLFIARINKSDSGNYTCSINSSHEYSITVHILNGESFAELHHGSSSKILTHTSHTLYIFLLLLTIQYIALYKR